MNNSFPARLGSFLLALAGTCSAALAQTPPSYRVEYLGEGWTATGINENGTVCGSVSPNGTALLAGVSHAGGPFEYLPLPPGMQSSRAFDINDAGEIVGAVCPNQYVISQPTAAVWRPTADGYTVQVLGTLPTDPYSAAYSINNVGDIIGGSGHTGWNPANGVLFTATGPVPLPHGVLSGDINNNRIVLANNGLLDLNTGQLTQIPLPPGIWQGFAGAALNDNNDFCGYIQGNSGCSTFPIRYRQNIGWEVIGGCSSTTSATAINDRGDALQYVYQTTAGVSFVNEGYFQLGNLIDPSQGAWFVQYGGANGINNKRQIIAAARPGFNGRIGAVRLTPITAPCYADFNQDGGVDGGDIEAFFLAWEAGDPAADVNENGGVDGMDVETFFLSWQEGGC